MTDFGCGIDTDSTSIPQVSLDAAEFFHVVFKIAPWLQRIDMSILDAVSVWKPRQKLTWQPWHGLSPLKWG